MNSESWNWKNFKLALPGFLIARVYTGLNLIELDIKIREQAGERQELSLTYDFPTFKNFIGSLNKVNTLVSKKNFGNKVLKYDFSSENRIELTFYFSKDEFRAFYQFLEDCHKEIKEQEQEYKKLTKEGE